jgi:2',3'-cyclic-nucleotide 2'-phosphodiesterase (5'-nucleotidase family)
MSTDILKAQIVLLLAVLMTVSCAPTGVRSQSVTISVVGTNDLHGGVLPTAGHGGLALLDGYIKNLRAARAADGGGVLVVDAGDLFQGTLESNLNEGAVVVAAYNAIGYTAAAIGNHEFDFGPVGPQTVSGAADDPRGALRARAAEARFPFLSANIIDEETGRSVEWPNVHPSTVVDIAGVRVGIVGLATRATLTATLAANTRGLSIAPLASALEAESEKLRKAGASVIVATAHAGGMCTRFDDSSDLSSCAADSEIFDVARSVPPGTVDLIVAGHRHEGIAHVVAGVPIISSYSSGRAFGRVDLVVDRRTGHVQNRRIFPPRDVCARDDAAGHCAAEGQGSPSRYEGQAVVASREIETILAPAVARANEVKWTPLNAQIVDTLSQDSTGESALGNLVADWTRLAAGTDAAITNTGGLRSDLPAGPLTYGGLYEVIPFDNLEVVVSLTGRELRRVFEINLGRSGSMALVSGLRVAATCSGPALGVTVTRADGVRLRDTEAISVAIPDFLATGGDGFFGAVMPLRVVRGLGDGPIQREHIAEWLKQHGGGWRSTGLADGANRRVVYPGKRPVTCGVSQASPG